MSTQRHEKPFAIIGQGTIFDGIAYRATLVGVYLMVGGLMFYSGNARTPRGSSSALSSSPSSCCCF